MSVPEERSFTQSVGGKIIAAFLIGSIAVALSWVVIRVGFKEILGTVDRLSAPNEKLRMVNDLFHNITRLDQLQKTHALRYPDKPDTVFQQESFALLQTIDSLRQLSDNNLTQVQRLDSMKVILQSRNQLFNRYYQLRSDFVKDTTLSQHLKAVTQVLASRKKSARNHVVRTRKKITTTIVPADSQQLAKKNTSFFGRIFGNRKSKATPPLQQVKQELHTQIESLPVSKEDKTVWQVQKIMRRIEGEQHSRTARLLAQELALIKAEAQLHDQLLRILQAIEAEEINLVKNNTQLATMLVNASISRIKAIIIVTALVTALLLFLIMADISRSNKYRRQLIAAKEEAEYLGQVKQRFLANMSHEIRTPLQSIIGFAEQLRQQKKPNPDYVEAIYRSSDHLLQIVNEVLDYSRIVSDTFTFEHKPFEMHQLAEEVVDTMRPQALRKGLEIVLDESSCPKTFILGDAFRLRQVLYNLLGNAIKFTEQGQVSLKLSAVAAGDQVQYCLAVQDTGIGIPVAEKNRIFKAFEQVNEQQTGTSAGTGLGLSIVKALVEGQGGSIEVSSEPGKGSIFTIKLAFSSAGRLEEQPGNLQPAFAGPLPFSGEVLVVDDDAFILELCSAIFSKHYIRHRCCPDARTALETTWGTELQLVLLDIRMPGMSGLELCQVLRSRLPANCRVVALTAQALPQERETILQQGFDGLLMKPFREQELLALTGVLPVPKAPEVIAGIKPEIDFTTLIRMTGGEQALLIAVLHQFMAETQEDLDQWRHCLRAPDRSCPPRLLVEIVHRLAGRTGQLGARKLSAQLRAVEAALLESQQVTAFLLEEMLLLQQAVSVLKGKVAHKLQELQEAQV